MNQDQEHLRLLSLFHYVCAGLTVLFSCIPIFHLVLGLIIAMRPHLMNSGKNPPPVWFGWIFVAFALVIILSGWTLAGFMAWAGRCLGQRRNHTFCLVVAGVSCLFMPFGTVLGVFTIIVLSRPSVRALFSQPSVSPS